MNEDSRPSFVYYAWQVLFALFYPFLITFSLLFTGLLWVFSGLSRLLVGIGTYFTKKNSQSDTSW